MLPYNEGVGVYDGADLDSLYFIETEDGCCKIGRSKDPVKRLAAISKGAHVRMWLIGTLPRMGWQEKVWHCAFQLHRRRGEWFSFVPELRRAIAAAQEGKEWIATLDGPPYLIDRKQPDEAFLVDRSPQSLREFRWRNFIADMEEEAMDALHASKPHVLRANATPTPLINQETAHAR